ncbi:hypothetical protein CK1_01180 [Ruminococcus sp. SR1/5]|nr:hypothetical protein CK1_01180 [Ruminococcus sp. SR1/5]
MNKKIKNPVLQKNSAFSPKNKSRKSSIVIK